MQTTSWRTAAAYRFVATLGVAVTAALIIWSELRASSNTLVEHSTVNLVTSSTRTSQADLRKGGSSPQRHFDAVARPG